MCGPLALCVGVESHDTIQYHCTLFLYVNAVTRRTKEREETVLEIIEGY